MQLVIYIQRPEQESALLATTKTTAVRVIPELVLAQEGAMITPTLVETKQRSIQIMEASILKPWGTSWFSDDRKFVFFVPC